MIAAGHIGANASSRLHHSEGHRCNLVQRKQCTKSRGSQLMANNSTGSTRLQTRPTFQPAPSAPCGGTRFRMTITGQLSPCGALPIKSNENEPSNKLVRRRPPLRLNITQSSEGFVLRTRIFIARRLLALSASLASLAVWIAPEIVGEGK